jgi:hypothetical protein
MFSAEPASYHPNLGATASAEGRLIKGGPFPASATAEGRQLNGAPSPLAGERAIAVSVLIS